MHVGAGNEVGDSFADVHVYCIRVAPELPRSWEREPPNRHVTRADGLPLAGKLLVKGQPSWIRGIALRDDDLLDLGNRNGLITLQLREIVLCSLTQHDSIYPQTWRLGLAPVVLSHILYTIAPFYMNDCINTGCRFAVLAQLLGRT